ncbi:hypothetical protein BGZ65_010680 [Modicella reniformis]|uniref:BZIP domain-containing protein n=1 Tax=Modicella reniformis TaxID=1440133 RepID=A0A9P6J653_9FUNG|nr:hypothetical protein BGZ65_010680 [Modicella reniformis]
MSNPMFDDFIELDLLDPTEPSSGLFSFYLTSTSGLDDNSADLGAAAAALAATPDDDPTLAMDLAIKQEDVTNSNPHMLLDSSSLDSTLELPADTHQPTHVFGEPSMGLIGPDQLTITPPVTTVSPTTISLSTVTSSSVSTSPVNAVSKASSASISTAATAVTSAIERTAVKRVSPEPIMSPRKHAKTESVSKSKSSMSSAKRNSTSGAASGSIISTASINTAASVAASSPNSITSPTTSSSSSSGSSSPTYSSASPELIASPVNTTLSPATLQFLLQQQEETPLIPQLFTGKLSREEIEATLARLLESTKHLIATPEESLKVKEEAHASDDDSDDNGEGADNIGAAMHTHGLKTQPGIKTDDIPSSTDLKKMTSKERRQLRNKISARNFRVRRKEYIFTLEGQVQQHKTEARHLREAVTLVQEENQRLKNELEMVKRQLAESTTIDSAAPEQAPLSKENQTLLSSILNRSVTSTMNPSAKTNLSLAVARPQSPILTPNLHKDVPNSSSGSAGQSSWKDKNPIMVHTTLVPEICLGDEFQFGSKATMSKDDDMFDRPWMRLDEAALDNANPFWVSGVVSELMKTFTNMSMAMANPEIVSADELVSSEVDTDADLDWELQQNLWALTQLEDEGEMTEEQVQLLYDLSQLQFSSSRSESPASTQEDPNMTEWLYESMMARLVDLDLQSSQDQSFGSFTETNLV